MDAGKPDPAETPREPRSLSHRLGNLLRGLEIPDGDWRLAAIAGALIATGPLATIAGAKLLIGSERAASARLQASLEPRLAAERAARDARAELGRAVWRPAMGTTLEALARVLPADATLTRAERTRQGALELDIATTDPDALRATIRRAPEFAGLRDTSQRRGDAAMIVSMRGEGE